MPVCIQCQIEKPLTEFYKAATNVSGYANACKECKKEYGKSWYCRNKHTALFKTARKTYRQSAKGRKAIRNASYRYKYGVDATEKSRLLESQNGRCASCGTDTPHHSAGWALDHDHTTLKIRGVLCQPCNTAIAHAKEDVERLAKCIAYLKMHKGS